MTTSLRNYINNYCKKYYLTVIDEISTHLYFDLGDDRHYEERRVTARHIFDDNFEEVVEYIDNVIASSFPKFFKEQKIEAKLSNYLTKHDAHDYTQYIMDYARKAA